MICGYTLPFLRKKSIVTNQNFILFLDEKNFRNSLAGNSQTLLECDNTVADLCKQILIYKEDILWEKEQEMSF